MDLSDYFDALTYVSYELVVSSTGLYASYLQYNNNVWGGDVPFAFPCLSGAGGPGMSTLEAQGTAA